MNERSLASAAAILLLCACGKSEPHKENAPAPISALPATAPAKEPRKETPAPEVPKPATPSPPQGKPGSAIVIERRVRLVSRDVVNKASEIQRREIVKILNGNVVVEDLTFGTRLVIRADRRLAWVIDRTASTYSELTFEAVAERRRKVLGDLAEAKKRVAGTPDAEDIDTILAGLGEFASAPAVEVRDTGRNEEVAGRKCSGRELLIGKDIHYIDVVVDPSLSDALAYFDALAAMGAFHPTVAEKIRTLGGFPLKGTVRYALFLDRVVSTEEVVSVSRPDLPAADFDLPADLKRVPLKGFDPDAGPKPEKPKNFERSFREDEIDRENNPLRDAPKDPKKP